MKLYNTCHSVWKWIQSSVGLKTSQIKFTGKNNNILLSASASAVADIDQTPCLNNMIMKCCWIWIRFFFPNLFKVDSAWWAQSSLSVISGAEGYFPWKTWIHVPVLFFYVRNTQPNSDLFQWSKVRTIKVFSFLNNVSPSESCSEVLRFVEVVSSATLWNKKKKNRQLWEGKWRRFFELSFWYCSSIQMSKPQKNHL